MISSLSSANQPPSKTTNLSYFWQKKTILSFLLVILVIIIHNSTIFQYDIPASPLTTFTIFIHNFFAYGLGSIAVPFFFLVSGIAFFRNYTTKSYHHKLRSRIKSLLVPYLFWNLIGLLFAIIYTYTPISSYISGRELFTPSLENVFEGIFLHKYNFQFWFIYDLMFYVLITPIIHLIIKHKQIGLIFCIFSLFLPLFTESFLNINTLFTVFYLIGAYIGKHHLSAFTKPTQKTTIIISTISALFILLIKMLSIYNIASLHSTISQVITIILLFNIWHISDYIIPKIKHTPQIMHEFFPLYTLHTYFLAIIIKLIFIILPQNAISLFINELTSTTITTLAVSYLASMWHKKLPKSYNFAFGNRKNTSNQKTINRH